MKKNDSKLFVGAGFIGLMLVLLFFVPISEKDGATTVAINSENLESHSALSLSTNLTSGSTMEQPENLSSLSSSSQRPNVSPILSRTESTKNDEARAALAANSIYGGFVRDLDRSPKEKIEISKLFASVTAHNLELHDQWEAGLITIEGYVGSMLEVGAEIERLLGDDELEKFQAFRDSSRQRSADASAQWRMESNSAQISGLTEKKQQRFLEEYVKLVGEWNEFKKVYFNVEDLRQVRLQLEDEFEPGQLYVLDVLIMASTNN